MTDAIKTQADTRVERLVEAIEALALSSIVLREADNAKGTPRRERDRLEKDHEDAREELRVACAEFTTPLVRLISGAPQAQEAQGDDRVVCGECSQDKPCHRNCCFWHAAIARKIDSAPLADDGHDANAIDDKGNCTFCGEPPVEAGDRCPHRDCPHAPAPSFA